MSVPKLILKSYFRAIGRELAKVERMSLVTGGFFGAADITAKTFSECKENNVPDECSVVHILPMTDSEARLKQLHSSVFVYFLLINFHNLLTVVNLCVIFYLGHVCKGPSKS